MAIDCHRRRLPGRERRQVGLREGGGDLHRSGLDGDGITRGRGRAGHQVDSRDDTVRWCRDPAPVRGRLGRVERLLRGRDGRPVCGQGGLRRSGATAVVVCPAARPRGRAPRRGRTDWALARLLSGCVRRGGWSGLRFASRTARRSCAEECCSRRWSSSSFRELGPPRRGQGGPGLELPDMGVRLPRVSLSDRWACSSAICALVSFGLRRGPVVRRWASRGHRRACCCAGRRGQPLPTRAATQRRCSGRWRAPRRPSRGRPRRP